MYEIKGVRREPGQSVICSITKIKEKK